MVICTTAKTAPSRKAGCRMDIIPENLSGTATMADGTIKKLTHDECKKIYEQVNSEKNNRAIKMPTEQDAIDAMFNAYQRLIELGWTEAPYCPKDGSPFKAIEAGSTGIFDCVYSGEWPTGHYLISDHDDLYCSHPILIKEQDHD